MSNCTSAVGQAPLTYVTRLVIGVARGLGQVAAHHGLTHIDFALLR